jgi:hypothetical protein
MQAKGYVHDEPIAPKIIAYLVDQFAAVLKSVAQENAHVRHIDARGTVKNRWHDELHPKEPAARDVAALFEKEIAKLLIS